MRLSSRILVPIFLVLTVLAGLWITLYVILEQHRSDLASARQEVVSTTRFTRRLAELQESIRGELLSYYFDGKRSHLDSVSTAERKIRRTLVADGGVSGDAEVARLIQLYDESEGQGARAREEFLRAVERGDRDAVRRAFSRLTILSNRTGARLSDIASHGVMRMDAMLESSMRGSMAMVEFGMYGVALAFLLIAAAAVYLERRVIARLGRLAGEVERMELADGHGVDPRLERPGDEIGDVARAFNALAARLRLSYQAMRAEVTVRKRAERRLAGVIDSAMDCILAVDADRRIVLANPAAEHVFGYRAAELVGQPVDMLLPARPGTPSGAVDTFGRIIGRRAGGEEFPVEASISLAGDAHEPLYTVVLRDVTAREAAENEARTLTAELQRRVGERDVAIRELEAFSYSVSHDLRSPLNAIDGFSRAALEDYSGRIPEDLSRYLELCANNAVRMGEIIDDLLRLSQLGRQQLTVRPIDVQRQVRDCVAWLEPEQRNRAVEVVVDDLPAYEADPGLMRQVWANLIGNSFKFTRKAAAARIEIGSFRLEDDAVVYYVRDNGAGFDMRYSKQLFEAFRRLHSASEFPGSGVGLAITARIVERHGGRIWAEGRPGAGSTFYFTLGKRGVPARITEASVA